MPATAKDCPLCGAPMRVRETQRIVQIPGNPGATTQTSREWVCPNCDYFEDDEEDS